MEPRFVPGQAVIVEGKPGIVLQYRRTLQVVKKGEPPKWVGDGRTLVAFVKPDGENVIVKKIAYSEDKNGETPVKSLGLDADKALKEVEMLKAQIAIYEAALVVKDKRIAALEAVEAQPHG